MLFQATHFCFGGDSIYIDQDSDIAEVVKSIRDLISSGQEKKALDVLRSLKIKTKDLSCNVMTAPGVYKSVDEALKQIILNMSTDAQKLFRMEQDVLAKLCLKDFYTSGDKKFLEKIVSQCYLSIHKKKALKLLSDIYLEKGIPEQAVYYLNMLKKEFPLAYENRSVSLKLILCYHLLGEVELATTEEKELVKSDGSAKIIFLGVEKTITNLINDIKTHFKSQEYNQIVKKEKVNWFEYDTSKSPGNIKSVAWRSDVFQVSPSPNVASGFPAIWKDNVVVCTGYDMELLNMFTGKLAFPKIKLYTGRFPNAMRSCIVNGNIAYANLTAIDLETRQTIWHQRQVKTNSKSDSEFLKSCEAVSAPTYKDGILYYETILRTKGLVEQHVIAVEAKTEELKWRRFICALRTNTPPGSTEVPYQGNIGMLLNGNKIHFTTEYGLIGTLDKNNGQILWLKSYMTYPPTTSYGYRRRTSDVQVPSFAGNMPTKHGDIIIFAPRYSIDIFWLKDNTGDVKGIFDQTIEKNQLNIKYAVGVYNGRLIGYGDEVFEFDVESGKKLASWGKFGSPTGKPLIAGDYIYIPVSNKLVVASLKDKKEVQIFTDPSVKTLGNLVFKNGLLYSMYKDNVCAFYVTNFQPKNANPEKRSLFKPDPKASANINKVEKLIYDLGDVNFNVRDAASTKLLRIGPDIIPQLEKNNRNNDVEIAMRTKYIQDRMGYNGSDKEATVNNKLAKMIRIVNNYKKNKRDARKIPREMQEIANQIVALGISAYPHFKHHFDYTKQKDVSYRVWALDIVAQYKDLGFFTIPDLVKVLKTDPDNKVTTQAHVTLQAITGEKFPINQPQKYEEWYKTNQ